MKVSNLTATRKSAGTVLVVDDMAQSVSLLTALLTRESYAVHGAASGEEALEAVELIRPDLILMDVKMPGMSGLDICRLLKNQASTRLIPIVLITALNHPEDRIQAINAGADDFLTKPVNAHELSARVRSLIRLKRFTDDMESAESVIVSLALTIEARDPTTEGHCQRLAQYATALGAHLELPDDDLSALYRGGFLHDLGKVGIPDAVLLKPGRLTVQEFEAMKQHVTIGDRLCGKLRSLERVRPIVRSHHERLDGSGYPDGAAGHDIPLLAQIMGVVDVFDALTSVRPYKPAFSAEAAYDELQHEVRKGWRRADLVEEFISIARDGRLQRLIDDRMLVT